MSARDADRIFHQTWLGLAQPIEGLVFSVPVLADAQIAPAARPEITADIRAQCEELPSGGLALKSVRGFFESFLGYQFRGSLIERAALASFYAPEAGQEVRASFAISRRPTLSVDDPFAEFLGKSAETQESSSSNAPIALVWDLADDTAESVNIDLDKPEMATGFWNYPPTAKLERLLRHTGIPIGFLSNRRVLRLVYAPTGESTSHLTFRLNDLADPAGRPIALALELLFHANRTYGADANYTFEGLLVESRRRQADVTDQLAEQVFEAVETLLAGFEAAAARDCAGDRVDWLSAALRADHLHEGILNAVLRLVFILYAEDRSLLPVDQPLYAEHLSLVALYERLVQDAGTHPESMHHRFGAYGALNALFRAIYFGVRHGPLHVPSRHGKLFDPSAYPFLEGGLPDWTAAVDLAADRAQVFLPTIDDKTIYEVLHGLIVLEGQRLSYRDLSVEQIGAVYESLMGYRVNRVSGPAVRLGKNRVWVELHELRSSSKQDQKKLLEDRCDVSAATYKHVLAALSEDTDDDSAANTIAAVGGKKAQYQNRARAGQLVLQPTASRRSTGSHYTPPSLSQRVVRRTLEPILACLGAEPSADLIMQLKICDPAMGSGAFLVEACRFLGEQVVKAWRRSGDLSAIMERHGEPLLYAKRLIAERCLYGVDKNSAAVELAKLSLWLETLSADKPFTFLDHVLRHGDSLVGLDLQQIRSFHWSPQRQLPMIAELVDEVLGEVREHRDAILALTDGDDSTAQGEKRRLLELADLAMNRVKLVADACVGAFFSSETAKGREDERLRRQAVVEIWLSGDQEAQPIVESWATEIRDRHAPFHWHVELPEAFSPDRHAFLGRVGVNKTECIDAFIGNPPFMGSRSVAALYGKSMIEWLGMDGQDTHGNADYAAYFFRRAVRCLGSSGVIGMIATKALAEAASRVAGLAWAVKQGWKIYDVTTPREWSGSGAAVRYVIVNLVRGAPELKIGSAQIDGRDVQLINSRLREGPEFSDGFPLASNAGIAYIGNKLYGQGFVLTSEEVTWLKGVAPHELSRVFTYLRGETLTALVGDSVPCEYVINFGSLSLDEARTFPQLLKLVEERVKSERMNKGNHPLAAHGKKFWWQHGSRVDDLYAAISTLRRCLVVARNAKQFSFSWQPTKYVFSEKLYVFAAECDTFFAILQSRVHVEWAVLQGGKTGTAETPSYTASRCFDTFPFPQVRPSIVIPSLEAIGKEVYQVRTRYMINTSQGLTQLYNQLLDPKCDEQDVIELRKLHETMDRYVLDAYGWTDMDIPPFCPLNDSDESRLEQFRDDVIDRLFALNAQRAEEEKRLGATKIGKESPLVGKRGSKRKVQPAAPQSQLSFDTPLGEE
jgi:hypothetical protein